MEYILEMKDISKTFPGVKALDHVQLQVRPGEVHALMGENGAGKSTLMKILMGIYTKDEGGEILFNGQPYHASTPKEAMDTGVAMIHQELNPILDMTVYENIFVGRELRKNGLVDKKAEIEEAQRLIEECGLHVSPKETLRNLTVAQCQLIEIIKAISINAKVIIMDEPTAAITDREVELLFGHIRRLTRKGVAIIYISHRMDEIFSICDRVSVYRDGQYIGSGDTKDLSEAQLIKMMVGREIFVKGKQVKVHSPHDIIREGVALITEDRKGTGLNLTGTVNDNIAMVAIDKLLTHGLYNKSKARSASQEYIEKLNIKTPSGDQIVGNLSGGNQQKVVIAKWLLNEPDIIILDEPTRGLDVGAKRDIYLLLGKLVQQGKAVIMISSEIPELMGVCDRIMVMCEGNFSGEVTREEFSQERIMTLASAIEV